MPNPYHDQAGKFTGPGAAVAVMAASTGRQLTHYTRTAKAKGDRWLTENPRKARAIAIGGFVAVHATKALLPEVGGAILSAKLARNAARGAQAARAAKVGLGAVKMAKRTRGGVYKISSL